MRGQFGCSKEEAAVKAEAMKPARVNVNEKTIINLYIYMKRTPITWYGGKQTMLKHILPAIPEHKIYVEPFFGAKKLKIEVLTANYKF
jgi:site-specific DNA-adenine methylase